MTEQRISSNADTFAEGNLPLDNARVTLKSMIYKRHALKGQPERTMLLCTFLVNGKQYEQAMNLGGGGKKGGKVEAERYLPGGGGAYLVSAPGADARPLSKQSKAGTFLFTLQQHLDSTLRQILNDDIRQVPALEIHTVLEKRDMDFKDDGGKKTTDYVLVKSVYGKAGNGHEAAVDGAFKSKVEDAVKEILQSKGGKLPINSLPGTIFNGTWFADQPAKTAASTLATKAEFLNGISGVKLENGILQVA